MMMMMPTGFRFNPTDEELIEFLFRKLSGQEMQLYGDFIVERNVYELDPHHLQCLGLQCCTIHQRKILLRLRENDSREVSGRGWWRATGRVKKVYANYNNQTLVGFKRPLTFHRFSRDEPHDPRTKRNKAIKTNWIMHEYGLESYTTDWRLCKIKYKGKPSVQEELENIIRSAAEEQQQQQQQLLQDSPIQLPNLESNNCNYPEDSFFGYYNYYNNHEPSYYNYPGFIDFSGGQVQQQQYFQLDNSNINVYGSDNNNVAKNMQMEAINVENEQLNRSDWCFICSL